MVLVGGGCVGDREISNPPDHTNTMDMGDETFDPVNVQFRAEICDARAWGITPDTKDVALTVVRTPAGASVLSVPRDGGAVRGFRVDNRGDLFDRDVHTIREDRNYTGVTASMVADRLVVASLVDDKVALDIVSDDLAARHDLGDVSGTLITPVVSSRENQLAFVGSANGVVANSFSGGLWTPTGESDVTKASIVSLTAQNFHDDALVTFSTTTHECHMKHIATGREAVFRDGCDNARMAVDPATGKGVLIYEQSGNVRMNLLRINGNKEISDEVQVFEQASSPRASFDGGHVWVSYLDARGDIVVGFIDPDGNLKSRSLEGFRPGGAYDLSAFGSGHWVVGVHDSAFLSERICAVRE